TRTHPQKRDSYGPPEPPNVGLAECKRWACMLFLQRLKKEEHAGSSAATPSPGAVFAEALRHGRARGGSGLKAPPCAAAWCQCPPGSSGTSNCALHAQTWSKKKHPAAAESAP
ncbi:unnamed protein product, partial [Polarella glacialis]